MICPGCNESFESLGCHWIWNEDCVPEISEKQYDILRGVLMSDGWVGSRGRCIQAEWDCKEYCQYVSDELDWLVNSTQQRKGGCWTLSTVSHDEIEEEFGTWYESGEKKWDLSRDLTNETFRHLYAGDGSLKVRDNRSDAMTIGCSNEFGRISDVCEWISTSGYPKPTPHGNSELYFSTDDTTELLNTLEPVPGYKYKWGIND